MTYLEDLLRIKEEEVTALRKKIAELEAIIEVNNNNQKQEYYENR